MSAASRLASSFIALGQAAADGAQQRQPATASTSSFGKAAISPTTAPPSRPSTM
jgi:hypothetical protein